MGESVRTPLATVSIGRDHYAAQVTAGGHALRADEPPEAGGTDTGPSPWELLCASLGACTAVTLRMYADRKAWPLDGVTVTVTREERTLHQVVGLRGNLDDEQRARLIDIAGRCPVHRALHEGMETTTTAG